MVIRRGTLKDRAFVEDLGRRTLDSSVAAFREASQPMLEVAFERMLHFVYGQGHEIFVAEEDGRRVGFVMLLDSMPDEVTLCPQGFIAYMAIEPNYRVRGIARALLEKAEDAARGKGLPYMGLMVTEDNVTARKLYEAAGYITERRLLCKIL